uniref:WEB family protein n=1 Tax=Leersia perrieri TaxID=77586 RepID=A0A0D9VR30_9ORYZ
MAEIDTSPLESVQAALTHFQPRTDRSRFSPDRSVQEIDVLTKELATCKIQLEVKENEKMQSNLKLEALQNSMQQLSNIHDDRIAHLEDDNRIITKQQSEAAEECKSLRKELAVVRDELDAVKGSNAFLLREIELMETRMIMEKGKIKDALSHILQLTESVLTSAVAAIRAEEERSVFFQEITLGFFNSDKNREAIKVQTEMIESLESELLAKTVEIVYLQSQLNQAKEHHISSEIVAGNQIPQPEAVEDDDGEEFYTKEIDHHEKDGYVLVAKNGDDAGEDDGELKGKLEAARAEIGDLRFSLEEAERRAELAEEAKAALERALREEIQRKSSSSSSSSQVRKTPPATTPLMKSGGDGRPSPGGCLTLGKVLNMKYK